MSLPSYRRILFAGAFGLATASCGDPFGIRLDVDRPHIKLRLIPDAEHHLERYLKVVYVNRTVQAFGGPEEGTVVYARLFDGDSTHLPNFKQGADGNPTYVTGCVIFYDDWIEAQGSAVYPQGEIAVVRIPLSNPRRSQGQVPDPVEILAGLRQMRHGFFGTVIRALPPEDRHRVVQFVYNRVHEAIQHGPTPELEAELLWWAHFDH